VGAYNLIGQKKALKGTVFYRLLSTQKDRRYTNGQLGADTYVTTNLEQLYLNTGFAAVGRLALPLSLPASYVIQYELEDDVDIEVGTVAPLFGQSGGGVEIRITDTVSVKVVGLSKLPNY